MPDRKTASLAGRIMLKVTSAIGLDLSRQRGQFARPHIQHHHTLRLPAPLTLIKHGIDADGLRVGTAIARPANWCIDCDGPCRRLAVARALREDVAIRRSCTGEGRKRQRQRHAKQSMHHGFHR